MAIRLMAANSGVQLELTSGRTMALPDKGYALAHDEYGEFFPKCVYWIVPILSQREATLVRSGTLAHGYPYWRDSERAFPGTLFFPEVAGSRLDSVKNIMYFFPGYGWCEHRFQRAVNLYSLHSQHLTAWRIGHDTGCSTDRYGFR